MNSHEQQETMEAAAKAIHEGLQAPMDDELAGLPELPEGQFWRVASAPVLEMGGWTPSAEAVQHAPRKLRVSLMESYTHERTVRRRGFLWDLLNELGFAVPTEEVKQPSSRPIAQSVCATDDADGVLEAAWEILEKADIEARRAALIGDYQPHRLGDDGK